MEFASFAHLLLIELELDPGDAPIDPAAGLYDDLGIDSFQAFKMLIVIEVAAGLDVPPPELPEIYTLGDAYAYYQRARKLAEAFESA